MSSTVPRTVDLLLVEDQPSDAELALRALRPLHLDGRIHRVKTGTEALDFLFGRGEHADRAPTDAPRLVLLDLKLPAVGGRKVLRILKSDNRTAHIPVVVLSSSTARSDVRQCYALGANSYVVKPVDFGRFTETVQRVGAYWLEVSEPC